MWCNTIDGPVCDSTFLGEQASVPIDTAVQPLDDPAYGQDDIYFNNKFFNISGTYKPVNHALRPLVSGSYGVPDSALTASNSLPGHGTRGACLHSVRGRGHVGAWCPTYGGIRWVQV